MSSNAPSRRAALGLLGRTVVLALTGSALAGCTSAQEPPAPATPPPWPGAVVSISLDDGSLGHLQHAQPVLAAARLPATFYLISDALGYGGSSLDVEQAKQLVAAGQEIGNHTKTHQDLTTLSSSAMVSELTESQNALTQSLGVSPRTCAYPYGATTPAVEAEAATLFAGCRSTSGGDNGPETDPYDLATFVVTRKTTVDDVTGALDEARRKQTWLIFTFHGVDPQASSDLDITPDRFSAFVQTIQASGLPVKAVGQALRDQGR